MPLAQRETTPSEPSFDERRDTLFSKIVRMSQTFGEHQTTRLVGRVFEYSVEDGLRLAGRLRLTPLQYQDAVLTPEFLQKHQEVCLEVDKEVIRNETKETSASAQDEKEYFVHNIAMHSSSAFYSEYIPAAALALMRKKSTPAGLSPKLPYAEIDELYLDAFLKSPPTFKARELQASRKHSKAELLAERYLDEYAQPALERRLYTGPVKEMFRSIAQDPVFIEPTITEAALREVLEKYKIQSEEAMTRLKSARVASPLNAVMRLAARTELLQELKQEVPKGMMIIRDTESNAYRMVKDEEFLEMKETVKEDDPELLAVLKDLEICEDRNLGEYQNGKFIMDINADSVGFDTQRARNLNNWLRKRGYEALLNVTNGKLDDNGAKQIRRDWTNRGFRVIVVQYDPSSFFSFAWRLKPEQISPKERFAAFEEKALDEIEKLLAQGAFKSYIAQGLAGLDSERAWNMREKLLTEGAYKDFVAMGLAGLDSERAWNMREKLLTEGASKGSVAMGLVGLDSERAWQLRERFLAQGADKGSVALGLAGDYTTFVWRLRPEWNVEEPTGEWQAKLDLLNFIDAPTLDGIEARQKQAAQQVKEKASLTQRHADVLGEAFASKRDAAQAYLKTNPAVADRSPKQLAELLLNRMVPSIARAKKPSLWSRVRGALSGGERPAVSSASAERSSLELMGGGTENLADTRRVLESREDMDALFVQEKYGRYDADKRTWEKVYFSVRRESPDPAREVTLTLVDVAGAGRVSLMLPLDARLITERVRGLTSANREIPIEPLLNSIGEATVEVPPGVVRILYSVERPVVPEPMHDPTPREFERFMREFERAYGKDMTARLASLPHDIEAELKRPEFTSLGPKQKVLYIEELVRRVGWYDVKNQEVSKAKAGQSLEEQIVMCEERLDKLRAGGDPSAFAGKKFAGVCADFALITCALLRKAGFAAGIQTGFHIAGKTAEMKDAHATAFVVWPDGRGGIRIIPVDGTPSSPSAIASRVARPSLEELEAKTEKIVEKEVAEAESVIAKLLASTKAQDVASIRALKNSRLEHALNIILRHEVKASHLRIVDRILNAYLYGGFRRMDRIASDIELRKAMEDEIARERKEIEIERKMRNAKHASQEKEKPAGTRLLETTREFIAKFQRGGAATSSAEAFELLDRVAELSKGGLSDVEQRAFVAVVEYLRAEQMR